MISVIVPVYNAESFLDECVQSILSQTYKDFELILVDDGSKDRSAKLCDWYAEKDKRVRVIHKKNGGPSEARNVGVKESKGSYISFIDSDDIVHLRYLETLTTLINDYNCDISAVKLTLTNPSEKSNKKMKGDVILFDGKSAVKDMLYQKNLDTSPCALLIRRDIVERNPFPVGRFHEDDFTMYKYYLDAKKVALCTDVLYFYIQRTSGIMNSVGKVSYDEIAASSNLVEVFKSMDEDLYKAALSKKFSNYCQILLKQGAFGKDDQVAYEELTSYVKKVKWQIMLNKECRIKNRIAAFSLIFGVKGLFFLNLIR